DPIDLMRSSDPRMSAADAARLKALYGLDQPLLLRYAGWARQALAGDLGYSRLFSVPVWGALLPRLGNSLLLMLPGFVLAFALAQCARAGHDHPGAIVWRIGLWRARDRDDVRLSRNGQADLRCRHGQ